MNTQQPSSGDLKDLVHQHKHQKASPPSLLERRQCSNKEDDHCISPMPMGAERMAALRDLGATFEEGKKTIAKVATPTETIVPSFVDSDHLEEILHDKQASSDKQS
ncbi:hypothetical protein BDF21DRAFT_491010 [Thamnidium elegans]|uniref:Uncharacterized protein n=1 Tax=Thamnidium elegans TaxID=101142 RepID=A0A8H7VV34_9FUNG|nr:hypothetical protein INT48_002370 [Thamnidium elegans]KAI8090622.1 hypothetical protein BDF21DRAFT_491010 [Thamnidium elegans]